MIEIPKSFWKYYDLYRRKKISLHEFSSLSELEEETILVFLDIIKEQ